MAADLDDLKRLKVTAETRAWLQAEALTSGRSKQEIARDALHEIALSKIRAAKVLTALVPAEGRAGDVEGHSRDSRGQGARR
jgi:hypothetical protein